MIKTKNIQLCQIKEKSFKKDRNEIVYFIKINRKSQYQKFFEENKNSKAIWQGIHNIIYSKKWNRINTPSSLLIEGNTITDSQDISEHFNSFFIPTGQDLQKNIDPTSTAFLPQQVKMYKKILIQSKAVFGLSKGSEHSYVLLFCPQHLRKYLTL